MKNIFLVLQSSIGVLLAVLVLLQNSKGGLGGALGSFDYYRTKRGAERIVFLATIIVAGLFLVTSIVNLLIR